MNTLKVMFIASFFCVAIQLFGQGGQRVNLDDPVQVDPGATEFDLNSFSFDKAGQHMVIGFIEVGGDKTMTFEFHGSDMDTRLSQFVNVALERKIIQELQASGDLGPGQVRTGP